MRSHVLWIPVLLDIVPTCPVLITPVPVPTATPEKTVDKVNILIVLLLFKKFFTLSLFLSDKSIWVWDKSVYIRLPGVERAPANFTKWQIYPSNPRGGGGDVFWTIYMILLICRDDILIRSYKSSDKVTDTPFHIQGGVSATLQSNAWKKSIESVKLFIDFYW